MFSRVSTSVITVGVYQVQGVFSRVSTSVITVGVGTKVCLAECLPLLLL